MIKKILTPIIILPNLPLIILIGIWMFVQIHKHTSEVDIELNSGKLLTPELKKAFLKVYTKELTVFIAVMFYSMIFFKIYLNY